VNAQAPVGEDRVVRVKARDHDRAVTDAVKQISADGWVTTDVVSAVVQDDPPLGQDGTWRVQLIAHRSES